MFIFQNPHSGNTVLVATTIWEVLLVNILQIYTIYTCGSLIQSLYKTYRSYFFIRNGLVQGRLDYFLVDRHLEYVISHPGIEPSINTDHSLLTLKIIIETEQKRGPDTWKMNCNLLQDSNYIATINTCINLAKLDAVNITDNVR